MDKPAHWREVPSSSLCDLIESSMGTQDCSYDAQRRRQLEEQVNALEVKLGDLHATDVSSLRRAYKTLAQHVQALDVESKASEQTGICSSPHLPSLLDKTNAPSVTSDFVAQQIQRLAAATAAVYAVGRLLRALRIPAAGRTTAGLALLGLCYTGVRLVAATVQRLGTTAARRRRARDELRRDLRALRERVQVMADLVESGLRLHGLHASQQSQLQLLQQQLQQEQQQLQQQQRPFALFGGGRPTPPGGAAAQPPGLPAATAAPDMAYGYDAGAGAEADDSGW
ncbi:hypothetical protein VOLCADRAFT_108156 [Volvox carteri f. nagariensis]|uniref:Uncharacterized protein n=1 Tax=Volvox carteri f. nagariensis TaxID=3068 RepID=D8UIL9_VOLCA|nr:uncharacterized protein VOLCADRAFT_108156 [Volvox carteri f. nagariensis]EFJ40435.1 hypothetical protein VOLCADRAFT_108156 [Volvox carteri f. nagariensis]|eukprot:XP_002958515.1 hypothetical protein VOLCADRAFT_108156 [Volvox carteri f. nagariensis]